MKIYTAITAIIKDIGAIGKARENAQQKYKYRGIDDFLYACKPLFPVHGVFFTTEVLTETREERPSKTGGTLIYTILKVKFTFFASDGSNVSSVTIGEALDSGDKSSNKAMSAALKYALMQIFCVPTDEPENDTESESHELGNKGNLGSNLNGQKLPQGSANQQNNKKPQEEPKKEPVSDLKPFEKDHPLADYEFPSVCKKFAGKKMGEIKKPALISYYDTMVNYFKEKPPTGKWAEAMDKMSVYLGGK